MDFEFGFKTLWPIAVAAFWFWVNNLSGRLKETDKRMDDLTEKLHDVKIGYQTKADAVADRKTMAASLHRIEEKIDKLAERKADK